MSKTPGRRALIRWGTVIAVVLSLLLGWELITSINRLELLNDDRAAAQAQLEEIEGTNESLEKQIELVQTDDHIIRMARKILGWVFPEDIRIVEDSEP